MQTPPAASSSMASMKRAAGWHSSPTTSRKQKKNKVGNLSLSGLKVLGEQLLISRRHINNLPILLEFINPNSPPQYVLESLLSLQSFFTPLLSELGSLSLSKCGDTDSHPEVVYRTWLTSKFDEFAQSLIGFAVSDSEDAVREVVLDSIMEFVKNGNGGRFHSAIYHKLLSALAHSVLSVDDIVLDSLTSKYFMYIDVRYFTYISLDKLARTLERKADDSNQDAGGNTQSLTSKELSIRMIHHLLSKVPPFGDSDENSKMWSSLGMFNSKRKDEHTDTEYKNPSSDKFNDKGHSPIKVARKMKLKFSNAWISFLKLELPLDVYKEVLATLHQDVIPNLSNPTVLCDFLTLSYDIGGIVSVMALSSLYILMTQHGLEYPNFYNKLYGLLEPSIFIAKHRAKFFQLLDSCLKSSLLPAYLAASFCKKLSRLALFIPPSGALVVIALVHNLLQRHPSVYFLVHKEGGNAIGNGTSTEVEISLGSSNKRGADNDLLQGKPGLDHFRYEESDPRSTNALRSSLWELDTLRHHYCPAVSRFALSLENDLSSKSKAAEIVVKDFCSGSYATIFHDEIRRRVKQVPLAFYSSAPASLFSGSCFPGWEFSHTSHSQNDAAVET